MKRSQARMPRRFLTALIYIAFFAAATDLRAEWLSHSGTAMGTEIAIELWHSDGAKGREAAAAVMAEMLRIDQAFSPWIETSELYRINKKAFAAPQPISDEMLLLLQRALFYSRLTDGAFDITFASVGRHYDYRKRQQPSDEQTRELLPALSYRQLDLDTRRKTLAFKHHDVQVDLGGIAKGYAVDRAIELLKDFEISEATVSAGGDSRVLGDRRGRPWMIGIKKPRSLPGDDEPAIVLPLEDAAVSTSGDYERYFIGANGERIHHIINPQTGRSARGAVSVSIIGRESMDTDALSTGVFVMGVEKGLALINDLPGFDCVIIDSNGDVTFSDGLVTPPTDGSNTLP